MGRREFSPARFYFLARGCGEKRLAADGERYSGREIGERRGKDNAETPRRVGAGAGRREIAENFVTRMGRSKDRFRERKQRRRDNPPLHNAGEAILTWVGACAG